LVVSLVRYVVRAVHQFQISPFRSVFHRMGLCAASRVLVWALVVMSLYPLCQWYAAFKQRRNDWWLSYI